MATPLIETGFVNGELAPGLFGSVDIARWHTAAATLRNCFVCYRRGAYSRAGTAFVGFSKQTGRSYPPRLLSFQQSINQGLALEFGNLYMRVISDGAFVTDVQGVINAITQGNPTIVTVTQSAFGVASATANNGGVTQSYGPSDLITLGGGVATQPGQLQVVTTLLLSLTAVTGGAGYVPGDTIDLAGGTQTTPAVLTVTDTAVGTAAIAHNSSPSVEGAYIMEGTTGTGTKFQVSMSSTRAGNKVVGITNPGSYTANPSNLAAEPMVVVSGPGTWTGLTLAITMGVGTATVSNAGVFTANPAGGTFTQASTSGVGTGATFNNALMGINALIVAVPGVYSTFPTNPAPQSSTNGTGLGATFNLTSGAVAGGSFNNGDWLFFSGVEGMTQLNGQTYVLSNVSGNTFQLNDVYGNAINSTAFGAYTGGGTVARLYTLTTPYSEVDLAYLKWTQSADVMTLCCVNQVTGTEYPAQDLERFSDSDWAFTQTVPTPSVLPPTDCSAAASASGDIDYAYEITAISPEDGSESIASNIGSVDAAVDISATAGTITVTWSPSPTANVNAYNVYKATPGDSVAPPTGSLFGFAGQAYGNQFLDSNVVPDFSQVPPTHQNPFARGQIIGANVETSTGTVTSVTFTINTSTGSGAVLEGVVVGSALSAILVIDPGQGYGPNDTVTVNVAGGGAATATLQVGAQSGTYPSCPAYFQERRVYANTLNNPDTYFMSQPGSFTNFDSRIPTIDTDAIIGSPWSVSVNGIQFMLNMPAGLLCMTGLAVWLLVGVGSFATNVTAISPSSQDALPQPEIGCSSTVPPVKIDYDVLYLSSKGTIYFDLPYQLYSLSQPVDLTTISTHLFSGFNILEHAWCREPFKLLWAVRSDGALLSLTFLKPEQVQGWARHDTQGDFLTVCSITELPVDALYLGTQRQIGTNNPYIIERMDDRLWSSIEDCWCVDCGFTLPQPQPAATLTASSATGLGAVTGVTGLVGGNNYSAATTATVVDAPLSDFGPLGPGTGAVPTLTIVNGVITAVTFSGGNQGQNYLNPQLVFSDPAGSAGATGQAAGSGAFATCVLSNAATFTANAAVFSAGSVGSVIRMGGGIIDVAAYISTTQVTGNILSPIVDLVPNSGGVPAVAQSGDWTLSVPVSSVYIPQLAGATITGLADGNVIPAAAVPTDGIFTLPTAASAVTIGFAFTAQVQSVYLDGGEPTIQGQRKKIGGVTARLEASSGVQAGSNQPDGSTLSPMQLAPTWTNLDNVPNLAAKPFNALARPLYTGDARIVVQGGFQKPGQVALQQINPLPLQCLALIPESLSGDLPEQKAEPRKVQQGRR